MSNLLSACGCVCLGIIGVLILVFETKVLEIILPGKGFINIILIAIIIYLIIMALDGDSKKGE